MRATVSSKFSFSDLRVRTQLGLAFAVLIGLSIVLGTVSVIALQLVNSASTDLAVKWLPRVQQLAQARAAMLTYRELEVKHTQAADASYMAEYEDKMKEAAAGVDKALQGHDGLGNMATEQAASDALHKTWAEYQATVARIVKMGRDGAQQDARDVSDGLGKDAFDGVLTAVDKLAAQDFEHAQASAVDADRLHSVAQAIVLGVVGASAVIGVVLAVLITRGLLRQLGGEPREATAVARSVAEGNLATSIHTRPEDRTSLMAALRDMQEGLAQVVNTVRQTSDSVATASSEIAQGNSDLSSRTETQASALQQTAASMDQLGSTVTQNAENAQQANELARTASEVAQRGGEAVNEVVTTMRGINESSRRIADITGVIDGIAFQTNILALNAAVEAARAGEQGRGFAVVAAEVRSLAQRSATAAKEIKSLISASVEQVQHGSAQVDSAGETMEQVVQSIRRVTEIVNEISAASREQSSGVHQVSEAVSQIDQTTQQNAALVEQSAAAAESLKHQARQLVDAVSVFKTTAHA